MLLPSNSLHFNLLKSRFRIMLHLLVVTEKSQLATARIKPAITGLRGPHARFITTISPCKLDSYAKTQRKEFIRYNKIEGIKLLSTAKQEKPFGMEYMLQLLRQLSCRNAKSPDQKGDAL